MNRKQEVNLLELIPCRNERIITEKEGELSVIVFPRFRSRFMQKYFVPKGRSPYIRVRLEEHGTAIWEMIDGTQSVGDIVEALAEHFSYEENYEYRITTYLSQLYRDGFIRYLS